MLLGTSRKSTIGKVLDTPADERLEGTLATTALGIAAGVDIVRVHDVAANVRTARMSDAIIRGGWTETRPVNGRRRLRMDRITLTSMRYECLIGVATRRSVRSHRCSRSTSSSRPTSRAATGSDALADTIDYGPLVSLTERDHRGPHASDPRGLAGSPRARRARGCPAGHSRDRPCAQAGGPHGCLHGPCRGGDPPRAMSRDPQLSRPEVGCRASGSGPAADRPAARAGYHVLQWPVLREDLVKRVVAVHLDGVDVRDDVARLGARPHRQGCRGRPRRSKSPPATPRGRRSRAAGCAGPVAPASARCSRCPSMGG